MMSARIVNWIRAGTYLATQAALSTRMTSARVGVTARSTMSIVWDGRRHTSGRSIVTPARRTKNATVTAPGDRVAIAVSDVTRYSATETILPFLLRETDAGREYRAALMREMEAADAFDAPARLADRAADLAGRGEAWHLAAVNLTNVEFSLTVGAALS